MELGRDRKEPTVGKAAPDFSLPCAGIRGSERQGVTLSDFRGRWLILVFYPRDFSLICPTELSAFSDRMEEFRRRGCEVLGISTDTLQSHERWVGMPREKGGLAGLRFPLASDSEGSVCRTYGVYLDDLHVALRGLFIVDPNGVLQYQTIHNLSIGRRIEELLRILAALQTGGMCAENWTMEDETEGPARPVAPGAVIANYRLEEQIGRGSYATVFRARDLTLQREVAVKILPAEDSAARSAVLAEARAAAALNHPNICIVFGLDESGGVLIIAMEYVRGTPLSQILASGPWRPEKAAGLGSQVASGLAAAHALGIVHGDLKPANIMVTEEGTAKILDFGLARCTRGLPGMEETVVLGMGERGQVAGTPGYMSPEQVRGEPPTPASDVFALGVILYEIVTGRRAFAGNSILQVFDRIRDVEPNRYASELPDPFAPIVRRALARDLAERLISMQEIAEALRKSAEA